MTTMSQEQENFLCFRLFVVGNIFNVRLYTNSLFFLFWCCRWLFFRLLFPLFLEFSDKRNKACTLVHISHFNDKYNLIKSSAGMKYFCVIFETVEWKWIWNHLIMLYKRKMESHEKHEHIFGWVVGLYLNVQKMRSITSTPSLLRIIHNTNVVHVIENANLFCLKMCLQLWVKNFVIHILTSIKYLGIQLTKQNTEQQVVGNRRL